MTVGPASTCSWAGRARRRLAAVITIVAALVPGVVARGAALESWTCWQPPVDQPISRPFDGPECPWCPGHRGVEFATPSGTTVHVVAAGTVTFAGAVAGRRFVTVTIPTGAQVTYGYLGSIAARSGQVVMPRAVVGVTGDPLLLTVRIGGRYVDPQQFLGTPRWPARLIPTTGDAPRPPPPPRWSCPARPP